MHYLRARVSVKALPRHARGHPLLSLSLVFFLSFFLSFFLRFPTSSSRDGRCRGMMMMMMFYLSDDGRRLAASEFLQFRNFQCDIDERLQRDLRVDFLLRLVGFVLLDVHSHRGQRNGTRQAEDESRTVREDESNALFRGDGTVNRVGVFKVVHVVQLMPAPYLSLLCSLFRASSAILLRGSDSHASQSYLEKEVSAVRLQRLGDFLDADEFLPGRSRFSWPNEPRQDDTVHLSL